MMIPEDIMTGLQSLAASENMNPRQRDLMTEGAALIKYQQHQVSEAIKNKKDTDVECLSLRQQNSDLNAQMSSMLSVQGLFRQQLREMADYQLVIKAIDDPTIK